MISFLIAMGLYIAQVSNNRATIPLWVECAQGNQVSCGYNADMTSREQIVNECVYGGRMDACQTLDTIDQEYNPAPFLVYLTTRIPIATRILNAIREMCRVNLALCNT